MNDGRCNYPPGAAGRRLIINADDFGLSDGVTAGILAAHRCGTVTSASLMVRWPAAARACDEARRHPGLALGLHLDLGEWAYRDGQWRPLYEVVPLDDADAVKLELGQQLDTFRALLNREPTHLDSHQHVHRDEPVRSAVLEVAEQIGVPVRGCTPSVGYCGDFYGQTGQGEPFPEAITLRALKTLLTRLPVGVTELACHPAQEFDGPAMYGRERITELEVLCDPSVPEAVRALGIELVSFADLKESRKR